jgi:hypothetical protein
MNCERVLRFKIKLWTWLFIVGLVVSGVTAIPLAAELDWLVKLTGADQLVSAPCQPMHLVGLYGW